jgi:molybdopterin-containing oxidoreductase family iron-sulfur binding subunit
MTRVAAPAAVSRRGFLRSLTALPLAPVPGEVAKPKVTARQARKVPGVGPGADVLIRMQAELQQALEKAPSERRWVMVIDLRKCVGCHACTIACVAENKLPPGVVYRPVLDEEIGTYPNVRRRFIPRPCMQCEEPPCVPVCPVSATFTNGEGVVVVDYNQCIGCRYCITACPYSARTFDVGATYTEGTATSADTLVGVAGAEVYERAANYEYGIAWDRNREGSPVGNIRKCHFCLHRVTQGMLPQCVTSCTGRATYFGDANDPNSLVAELINSPNVMRLKSSAQNPVSITCCKRKP